MFRVRPVMCCALPLAILLAACATDIPIGKLVVDTSTGGNASGEPPAPDSTPPSGTAPDQNDPAVGAAGQKNTSDGARRDAISLFDFRDEAASPYRDQKGSLTLTASDAASAALLVPSESGLVFNPGGLLVSPEPASAITAACMASGELSVEAWITPDGPQLSRSRLVTLSADIRNRNFALGVGSNDLDPGKGQCAEVSRAAFGVGSGTAAYFFRRRLGDERPLCSTCELNGYPELWTELVAENRLTHVVATHAADGSDRIYVDATTQAECSASGDFADWDPTYALQIGGESVADEGRHFSGIVHLVAIYDRALSNTEVQALFQGGL